MMILVRSVQHLYRSGIRFLSDKFYRIRLLLAYGVYEKLSDEEFVRLEYYANTGLKLDLSNPITFSEKLNWLKLHDHKPLYTIMSDKYLVKKYVASIIGDNHVIPTIGAWDNVEDIDFDSLPQKFVLKCNHNSGLGMFICKNKSAMNIKRVKRELKKGLSQNYYLCHREWSYKNIPRKVLAEVYMEDSNVEKAFSNLNSDGLIDYKFYCFNGEPKFLYVGFANMADGNKHDLLSFLSLDWKPTPFYREDHEQIPVIPEKPNNLNEMISYAKLLSAGIPFVRVDFFVINEIIYFSEFTFIPGGGYGFFHPNEWERKIGDWLVLPEFEGDRCEESDL